MITNQKDSQLQQELKKRIIKNLLKFLDNIARYLHKEKKWILMMRK